MQATDKMSTVKWFGNIFLLMKLVISYLLTIKLGSYFLIMNLGKVSIKKTLEVNVPNILKEADIIFFFKVLAKFGDYKHNKDITKNVEKKCFFSIEGG